MQEILAVGPPGCYDGSLQPLGFGFHPAGSSLSEGMARALRGIPISPLKMFEYILRPKELWGPT